MNNTPHLSQAKPKPTSLDAREAITSDASFTGGFVFESDAILSKHGRRNFLDTVRFLNAQEFKLIQLGGLKSTSGGEGQKINILSSLRNYFYRMLFMIYMKILGNS